MIMRRRTFISALGSTMCWPLMTLAQESDKPARVGVFVGSFNPVMEAAYTAFREELGRLGFVEGSNLTLQFKALDRDPLAEIAVEWINGNYDVLVTLGSEPPLKVLTDATQTIPIVFVANNFDPIARGYIQSLAEPGGNVTGIVLQQTELAEKQVELLIEALPGRTQLAAMWDYISADQFDAANERAKSLGLQVLSFKLENPPYDFDATFRAIAETDAQMLLVLSSPFFAPQSRHIAELAIRHKLPAMFIFKAYVEAGGLLSYGADNVALYRQSAGYVAKILRGAKPSDLPVEQPVKFDFAVNIQTAEVLGIELPASILARANIVIE